MSRPLKHTKLQKPIGNQIRFINCIKNKLLIKSLDTQIMDSDYFFSLFIYIRKL